MDLQYLLTISLENNHISHVTNGSSLNGGTNQNNSVQNQVVALLTKLCSSDSAVPTFLRDKLRLQSTLTSLLISVSLTNHSKCGKILDLLRYVCYNIQLNRQEAFLQDLITRLFE